MEEEIAEAARQLKMPAGDSKLFATTASVQKNRAAFVRGCHDTWKGWHKTAVQRLLFHEGFLAREKTHPLGPEAKAFGEYNRAVWRRINDTIVWSIFGEQRHVVKRLCLYRKRNDLTECHPEAAMATIADLNTDPLSFALWNDTTSCVDVGDVTYIKDGRKPVPEFLELKDGAVNAEIIEILKLDAVDREAAIEKFEQRFGKKGHQQLDRVVRQKRTGDQALALLVNDHGTDPVTGHDIQVVESGTKRESYDDGLQLLLEKASKTGDSAFECIDGCLWLFAATGGRRRSPRTAGQFVDLLKANVPSFAVPTAQTHTRADVDRIQSLSNGVFLPLVKPLILRRLEPHQVAAITYGTFLDNVLVYLDWDGFARLVGRAGGEFGWGSSKAAGRARALHPRLRPSLVRGRLPQVRAHGATAHVMDPNLVEMLYDGVTPWTIAQNIVESLTRVTKESNE